MATINGAVIVGAGTSVIKCGALRVGAVVRVASAALGAARAGVVSFRALAVKLPELAARSAGRRVSLRVMLRGAKIAAMLKGSGPGESAGESLRDLPAVWLSVQYPADYIGPNVAALALARGEAWARSGNKLTIAGRVVIGESGADTYFADDAAARRFVAGRCADAAAWLGVLSMQAGEVRDEMLSKRRDVVWGIAKRAAKAIPKVADMARRRAMMADIDFALRGV